jgi:hypothetical protein
MAASSTAQGIVVGWIRCGEKSTAENSFELIDTEGQRRLLMMRISCAKRLQAFIARISGAIPKILITRLRL